MRICSVLVFVLCSWPGFASDWLKDAQVPELARELGIHAGSIVADVGCGGGELSVSLARIVGPSGRVYCEDIDEGKQWGLPAARRHIGKQHLRNVTVVRGVADDPTLAPQSVDAVVIVNAYHEMPRYREMLRHIRESLRPGGRLVIVDNRPQRTATRAREKQTANHVLSIDLAVAELTEAGFRVVRREDAFIEDPDSESVHWMLVGEI